MTNVLAWSSAKQGSTKRLKGIAMLPVDGVKLREPLGPDKAHGSPPSNETLIVACPSARSSGGSAQRPPRRPAGHEGGSATAAGPTTRNLDRETR